MKQHATHDNSLASQSICPLNYCSPHGSPLSTHLMKPALFSHVSRKVKHENPSFISCCSMSPGFRFGLVATLYKSLAMTTPSCWSFLVSHHVRSHFSASDCTSIFLRSRWQVTFLSFIHTYISASCLLLSLDISISQADHLSCLWTVSKNLSLPCT